MRFAGCHEQRFQVVPGLLLASKPDITHLTADPGLATKLSVMRPSPAFQRFCHSETDFTGAFIESVFFQGMRATVSDVLAEREPSAGMSMDQPVRYVSGSNRSDPVAIRR
jgi:hypothetical protein